MGTYPQSRYSQQYTTPMTNVQTTMTVDVVPVRSPNYLTIRYGFSDQEDVKFTGIIGLQLTGLLRGLSPTALTDTEVIGLKQPHIINSPASANTVKMMTIHYVINDKPNLDNDEVITGLYEFVNGFISDTNSQLPGTKDSNGNLITTFSSQNTLPLMVSVSGGGGVNGAVTANVVGGQITSYTITNAGSGYATPPTITVTGGGGMGATAHATVLSGGLATIVVDTPGSGYATVLNYLDIKNGNSGNNVVLKPLGSDNDINIELQGKGVGAVIVADKSATKTSAAPTTDVMIANKKYVDDQIALITVVTPAGLQAGTATYAVTAGGTTVYTASLTPTLTVYTEGMRVYLKINASNTGASTLNIDSLGAKSIKKNTSQDVISGDLPANSLIELMYDGTNFCILAITSPYAFLTAKGDIIAASASNTPVRVPVGSNGKMLLTDSAQTAGLNWFTRFKIGNDTHGSNTTDVQTIAHGLGRVPGLLTVIAGYGTAGPILNQSIGYYDGTNTSTSVLGASTPSNLATVTNDSTSIVQMTFHNTARAVATFDATNIYLSWTAGGGSPDTISFTWKVE